MKSDSINNGQAIIMDECITERIVKNYELRLVMNLPEYDARFEHITIITPQGAFQLNAEIEQWSCRISAENFNAFYQELCFLLQRANEVADPEGILSYNILTLKQLNTLDQALRLHHGHTIIGYSICEEIYLRELNFLVWLFCWEASQYEYPPLPEAYSRRLLGFINKSAVLDVSTSFRVSAQSYLLFYYLTQSYFQYTHRSQNDFFHFFNKNIPWVLLGLCSTIMLSLILLCWRCIDKLYLLSAMIRLRLIEQSIIGMISNLTYYGPVVANTAIIEASFLPLIILGALLGYYKDLKNIINIAHFTGLQFLFRAFFLALTVGSFCALGFYGPIKEVFFFYDDDYNSTQVEFFQDDNVVRYIAISLMSFASIFCYPYFSLYSQYYGRYASNWINGISVTLLDNYALYLLIGYFVGTLNIIFSFQKLVAPVLFSALTPLGFILVFLLTFPTTPDLPEYSLEKNSLNPTWMTKAIRFFNDKISCCVPETESVVSSQTPSATSAKIELVSKSITRLSRAFNINLFYPSIQREETPSSENPLHKNTDHFMDAEKRGLSKLSTNASFTTLAL